MNHRIRRSLILILAALAPVFLVGSCASLMSLVSLSRPTASVQDIELTGLDFQQAELLATIRIDNPNAVAVRLAGLDYNLIIEGNSLVSGNLDEGIDIAAGGSSVVRIPITLTYQGVYQTVEGAKDRDELAYRLDLGLGIDIPGLGRQRLPLSHSGDLPVPRLPAIQLTGIELRNISLRSIDLELLFSVNNPNRFSLNLTDFRYSLSINGANWVNGAAAANQSFSAHNSRQFRVGLSLNILQVGQSVVRLLNSDPGTLGYDLAVNTRITSDMELLGAYDWGLELQGDVPLR